MRIKKPTREEQRRKAILLQARGAGRAPNGELVRQPPPVTLPKVGGLTLEEIAAKYGVDEGK